MKKDDIFARSSRLGMRIAENRKSVFLFIFSSYFSFILLILLILFILIIIVCGGLTSYWMAV